MITAGFAYDKQKNPTDTVLFELRQWGFVMRIRSEID